ncbi:hypothetical protein, partial [Actinophytocola sp.]|uniref:hypothetical protein n=1 Tax=Actinophytocola sp. TaxID=1872138 RepID=UPI002D8108B1
MGRRQLNVSRPLRYGPGRDALGPRRPAVPADGDAYDGDDYGGDDDPGTAGVREPRRPTPPGP